MRFKPSALVEDLNGTIGFITAAKNKACSYFKSKPIPTNPNTEAQQAVRMRFKEIALAYKALTAEQKQTWDKTATAKTGRSVFGVKANISGINLFQRVNQNLALVNAPYITTPSETPAEFPKMDLYTVDGCVTAINKVGEQGSTSGTPALVFNKFVLPENIVLAIRMSDTPVTDAKFSKAKTKIVTLSPNLIQFPASDEKNKTGKDLTIIPIGQEWTDTYHKRGCYNERVMISVEAICKTTGSILNVLNYVDTPQITVLGIKILEGNEIITI